MGLKYTTINLPEGYSLESIYAMKYNFYIQICKVTKSTKICDRDFQSYNWLNT